MKKWGMYMTEMQFDKSEIGEKAFRIYSGSTFEFYKRTDGKILASVNGLDSPEELDTLEDVKEWILAFGGEDDDQ